MRVGVGGDWAAEGRASLGGGRLNPWDFTVTRLSGSGIDNRQIPFHKSQTSYHVGSMDILYQVNWSDTFPFVQSFGGEQSTGSHGRTKKESSCHSIT